MFTTFQRLKPIYKGIILLTTSSFFFACMAFMVRISGDLPVVQKSFFRNLISAICVLGFFLNSREKMQVNKSNIVYLLLRSFIGSLGILANYYALSHLQLSNATMLQKLSPFATLLFSALILREKLLLRQGIYIAGAFLASLLVIKPNFASFDFVPSLVGLLGGIFAGLAYVFVRKLRLLKVEGTTIVLFFSLFSTIFLLPLTLIYWQSMTVWQTIYLIMAGFFAFIAQISITQAYGYAKAGEISIYDYGQVLYAMLLSIIFLGDYPDLLSVIGYLSIFFFAFLNFLATRHS